MGIAFTAVPENFDVQHLILVRHQKLFDAGLNETYFDVVIEHFRDTLTEMKVDEEVIHEALAVIMPLRDIFVQGAQEAKERRQKEARWEAFGKVLEITVVVALVLTIGLTRRAKHHAD